MDKLKMKIKKLTYEQWISRCIFLVGIFLSRILPYYALKFKAENYQPQKKKKVFKMPIAKPSILKTFCIEMNEATWA